ncbi:hypothetical protein QEW_3522 [Clostridioides difficile CD160]|nr:hypothetical protein QEW_3522 [Clostridioides difficile CD160]
MGAATIATMGAMNREVTDKELESATMGNALTSIISLYLVQYQLEYLVKMLQL